MVPKSPSKPPAHLGYAPPGLGKTLLRLALRGLVILAIAFAAQALIMQAMETADTLPQATRGPVQISVLVLALTLYALLIAMPFVPGIEIGVTLLVLQGATIAPFVYARYELTRSINCPRSSARLASLLGDAQSATGISCALCLGCAP